MSESIIGKNIVMNLENLAKSMYEEWCKLNNVTPEWTETTRDMWLAVSVRAYHFYSEKLNFNSNDGRSLRPN